MFTNIPGYGAPNFKDSVATASLLPLTGNEIGDVRTVKDTGDIYSWNGSSWVTTVPGSYIPTSAIGAANGVASLDGSAKVPVSQLPNTVMEYQGAWNASTNTPTLSDGTGVNGNVYRVSVAGTQNLGSGNITFQVGDFAIFSSALSRWQCSPAADGVSSVNGFQGAVVLAQGNLTENTSSVLTISGGTNAVWGSGTSILVKQSSSSQSGYLSSTDWTTFNNKGTLTGPVSSVNKGIARWNGTTGLVLADSSVIIDTVTANSLFVGSLPNQSMTGTQDTVFGLSSGTVITSGTQNSIFGYLSGNLLTTGNGNTLLGFNTGNALTTQGSNTLVGSGAGSAVTSSQNTLVGFQAGHAVTSNGDNAFLGWQSGLVNTAAQNTFIGSQAGKANTSGTSNTSVGYLAGGANTTSSNNTHVGWGAGFQGTGNTNTYIGSLAGQSAGAGSSNTAVGYQSGQNITSGTQNVVIGVQAGNLLTTGVQNTFLGQQSGAGFSTTSQNTMIGFGTGANNTGSSNTMLGWEAGFPGGGFGSTTGSNNISIGNAAGSSATTGSNNIILGSNAQLDANNATGRFIVGSNANPVLIGYFGQGGAPNAAPSNFTFTVTSASGTNVAGATVVLAGGRSTGSGVGGAIQFAVSIATGSSSTLNGLTTVGSVSGAGLWTLGAAGGTQVHAINGSASITGVLTIANGSVGAPSLATSDVTTGLYRSGANEISIAAGGVQNLRIVNGAVGVQAALNFNNASTPGTANSSTMGTTSDTYTVSGSTTVGNGGALKVFGSAASPASAIQFLNDGIVNGSLSNAGLWTLGASGGTQIHIVNGTLSATQDLITSSAGFGLKIKEGSNARMGTAVLIGGTVVVSNTSVTASTRIFLTIQVPGGTLGSVYISAVSAGASFTISSTSVIDTSTVAWLMVEPS